MNKHTGLVLSPAAIKAPSDPVHYPHLSTTTFTTVGTRARKRSRVSASGACMCWGGGRNDQRGVPGARKRSPQEDVTEGGCATREGRMHKAGWEASSLSLNL